MTEATLVGLWSADRRYGPGAMASEDLVFLTDHRGFWRYSNAGGAYIEAFLWSMNADGSLALSGTKSFEVEYLKDGESVTEEPGHIHFEGLKYRIVREDTPRGETLEVLTLDEEQGRWRQGLLVHFGSLSEKFALVRRDVDDSGAAKMF